VVDYVGIGFVEY
jgi:hypothetical protein